MPRFTVDFDQKIDDILNSLAEASGSTKAEVIRRAVSSYNFLKKEVDSTPEKKILIANKNNEAIKEVVLP